MDVHLQSLASSQLDLVARWQLVAAGYSDRQVDDRAWRHRWRAVHDGVYALTRAPLRAEQRWLAACLTAPGTVLADGRAAARVTSMGCVSAAPVCRVPTSTGAARSPSRRRSAR